MGTCRPASSRDREWEQRRGRASAVAQLPALLPGSISSWHRTPAPASSYRRLRRPAPDGVEGPAAVGHHWRRGAATAADAGSNSWRRGMEKHYSKTKFAPFRDAPIAPRDALGSSNTELEQTRGYTSSPFGALRLKVPPFGRCPLHTSRPLSAPVANRPLSLHLPLKKPQLSATFSISHRIFGVALGVAIISVPLATKFSVMFGV